MKSSVLLIVASLLSIVLTSLHLADDIVRGMEPGTVADLVAVPILVIWLYGTVVLPERRTGQVIILLGSLLGLVTLWIHFDRTGGVAGGKLAASAGALFFVWTLVALGVTAGFSLVLSVHELWRGRHRRPGPPAAAF